MTGRCYECHRERSDVETRYSHGAKFLCEDCAARPHRPPTASGLHGDDTIGQPDIVGRVLARLERVGLPVVGAGVPNTAGSLCPVCGAGMAVRFLRDSTVEFACAGGCPEPDITAALANGGGR